MNWYGNLNLFPACVISRLKYTYSRWFPILVEVNNYKIAWNLFVWFEWFQSIALWAPYLVLRMITKKKYLCYLIHFSKLKWKKGIITGDQYWYRIIFREFYRDQAVKYAAGMITGILVAYSISSLLSSGFAMANLVAESPVFPIWAIFLVLWMGHAVAFFASLYTVYLIAKSAWKCRIGREHIESWRMSQERRIPLIQYILYNLAQILSVSFFVFLVELFLYVDEVSPGAPLYIYLVPIYVVSMIGLLNSILCR